MTCPHCGAAVEPGERFCGNCGQEITLPGQPASSGEQTTRSLDMGRVPDAYPSGTGQAAAYSPPPQAGYAPPAQYYQPAPVPYAPAAGQGSPAVMWIGIALIGVGILAGLCFTLLAALGASSPDYEGESGDAILGALLCSVGLLVIFGVPGAILFFVGRRR